MGEPGEDHAFADAWRAHVARREKATFAVTSLLICVLVPLWSAFDFYLEPQVAPAFLALRLADVVVAASLWAYIARSSRPERCRIAMLISATSVGLVIAAMLPQVQSHYLLYVLGFSLVFWGCGLVLLWPVRYIVVTNGLILATHVALYLGVHANVSARDFIGSLFYLVSVAVISTAQLAVRRRLEHDAFRTAFALERRNADLALALADARLYREARDAVQLRDDFISIASHELRSPLATLGLIAESLRTVTQPPDPRAELVARLDRQVGRLAALVDQLLDVSRLASGRLALEPEDVDLVELVGQVTDHLKDSAARAGCEIRLALPPALRGRWDRQRLEQVLSNLIGNAIKYGAGRPLEVTLAERSERALLSVTDHGVGIHEADRARIFERFERATTSKQYAGFGVGLWLSRTIVEGMGGTIRVDSEVGRGSTFSVEVPLAVP